MVYKIEKNVPLSRPVQRRGPKSKYPLDAMEVGDSFFVPGKKTQQISIAYYQKHHPGFRVKLRRVEHNGRLGVRVWRVA